jgi:microsomal epoxide hydrolase
MQSFAVHAGDNEIQDLRTRLSRTRWPDQLPGSGWRLGTDRSYLQELCLYWEKDYDWEAFATRCNRFAQFTTEVEGQRIHFYHVRSPRPDALPLIITHGWPGSVVEFFDVLGPLSDPASHGGDPAPAFHVVAPSLPGYGFSGPTHRDGVGVAQIADWFDQLMMDLGYDRYLAQGGDWGASVSTQLAIRHTEHVSGLHLNMLVTTIPEGVDALAGLTEDEIASVEEGRRWRREETGYQAIQSTRPQTLGYGLTDSPAGLAGWIIEKFRAWSDCGGDLERSFTKDQLLDNLNVYWLSGTINSSIRLYHESVGHRRPFAVTVPTGHSRFPAEIFRPPRAWAEQFYNIVRWSTPARGGHFAAMEVPELFVEELRAFVRDLYPTGVANGADRADRADQSERTVNP